MGAPIYVNINPNKIKIDYTSNGNKNNLHYDSNYLNINTWYFGIDVNRPYGPSSGTGWYQGIDNRTIDDAAYTVYYTGSTIGNTGNANDKYRCVQLDQQGLIDFVDQFPGPTPTFEEALNFFKDDGSGLAGGKGSFVCVNMNYPNIPTSGLTFALDAGHVASYPWTASTWYDFTNSAMSGFSGSSSILARFDNGALYWGFNSASPFQYFVDNTSLKQLGNTFTIMFWAKLQYIGETRTPFVFSCAPTIGSPLNQSVGFYNTGGNVYFYYSITDTSGSIKQRIGVNILDLRIWHHYTFVFAPDPSPGKSNISFYVDGVLNETNQENFEPASWNPSIKNFTIGQNSTPRTNDQYIGDLQVLLAYNRVLSDQEIVDIYQNYYDTRSLFI